MCSPIARRERCEHLIVCLRKHTDSERNGWQRNSCLFLPSPLPLSLFGKQILQYTCVSAKTSLAFEEVETNKTYTCSGRETNACKITLSDVAKERSKHEPLNRFRKTGRFSAHEWKLKIALVSPFLWRERDRETYRLCSTGLCMAPNDCPSMGGGIGRS